MSWTHKARRDGRGCLGWSAAVRGQARISGSAGSDNALGPCSAYFLSLWTQTGKHVVTASKQLKIRLAGQKYITSQCDAVLIHSEVSNGHTLWLP